MNIQKSAYEETGIINAILVLICITFSRRFLGVKENAEFLF